jgi:hypothetical protein
MKHSRKYKTETETVPYGKGDEPGNFEGTIFSNS